MISQIEKIYPVKQGRIAKDKDENFMLLNAEGKAFSTNAAILLIWELCSGNSSIKDLCKEIKANSKSTSGDLTEKVSQIIDKLSKAKLVKLNEVEH